MLLIYEKNQSYLNLNSYLCDVDRTIHIWTKNNNNFVILMCVTLYKKENRKIYLHKVFLISLSTIKVIPNIKLCYIESNINKNLFRSTMYGYKRKPFFLLLIPFIFFNVRRKLFLCFHYFKTNLLDLSKWNLFHCIFVSSLYNLRNFEYLEHVLLYI